MHLNDIHIKEQRRIRLNALRATLTISQISRNHQLDLATLTNELQAFLPPLDDTVQNQQCRLSILLGLIEDSAIQERALITDLHSISRTGFQIRITGLDNLYDRKFSAPEEVVFDITPEAMKEVVDDAVPMGGETMSAKALSALPRALFEKVLPKESVEGMMEDGKIVPKKLSVTIISLKSPESTHLLRTIKDFTDGLIDVKDDEDDEDDSSGKASGEGAGGGEGGKGNGEGESKED